MRKKLPDPKELLESVIRLTEEHPDMTVHSKRYLDYQKAPACIISVALVNDFGFEPKDFWTDESIRRWYFTEWHEAENKAAMKAQETVGGKYESFKLDWDSINLINDIQRYQDMGRNWGLCLKTVRENPDAYHGLNTTGINNITSGINEWE